MDAPNYPPSTAYEAPVRLDYARTTSNTSIRQLLADPTTKAILLEELPGFEGRINNEQLQYHLDNFSPRGLVQFGLFKPAMLDKIDARFRALPQGGGGK